MNNSFFYVLKKALFDPKFFSENIYGILPDNKKFLLGYLNILLGLILGSLFNLIILANYDLFLPAMEDSLNLLNLKKETFLQVLQVQKYYSIISIILSPLLSYMLPHIIGGALWLFLNIGEKKYDLIKILNIVKASFSTMIFCAIPIIGPVIFIIKFSLLISRLLFVEFKLVGFVKTLSIIGSIYIGLFFGSDILKILALGITSAV